MLVLHRCSAAGAWRGLKPRSHEMSCVFVFCVRCMYAIFLYRVYASTVAASASGPPRPRFGLYTCQTGAHCLVCMGGAAPAGVESPLVAW
jgi:hypothetical protein